MKATGGANANNNDGGRTNLQRHNNDTSLGLGGGGGDGAPLSTIYPNVVGKGATHCSLPSTSSSTSNEKKRKTMIDNSSSTTTTTTKHLGVAPSRRSSAKKKMRSRGIKIITPVERQKQQERLREPLACDMTNLPERFGAALLRHDAMEFVDAAKDAPKALLLWRAACHRVGVTPPTTTTTTSSSIGNDGNDDFGRDDAATRYFSTRAALVLEESRHVLSESLLNVVAELDDTRRKNVPSSSSSTRNKTGSSNSSMVLTVERWERANRHNHCRVHLRNDNNTRRSFTPDELYHLRTGSVLALIARNPRNKPRRMTERVVLGMITSGGSREAIEKSGKFCLTVFRNAPDARAECGRYDDSNNNNNNNATSEEEWSVLATPVASLVTQMRCFEAMTRNPHDIPFLQALLGNVPELVRPATSLLTRKNDETTTTSSLAPLFRLPPLNASQEKAATAYLEAPSESIALVQGPPGTGKTTLLVSVIGRYLTQGAAANATLRDNNDKEQDQGRHHRRRRLMVCAPTNKAVLVLAKRFLASIANPNESPFNVVLVGDGEKLLAEDGPIRYGKENWRPGGSGNGQEAAPLRSIFVYSWMQHIVDEYRQILRHFQSKQGSPRPSHATLQELHRKSECLDNRLTRSLAALPKDVEKAIRCVTKALKTLVRNGEAGKTTIVSAAKNLIQSLEEYQKAQSERIGEQLVDSADVIFCTLASAGGTALRRTERIHDLIVDEAAASTEPEICIPLHLRPTRMLCVGDPRQLPATVASRRAHALGLSQSLQERLMYKCGFEHIILDVQYRMNPEISAFPSTYFYDSKIQNGENVLSRHKGSRFSFCKGRPYTFLKVKGVEEQAMGGSYYNKAEALRIVDLVLSLESQGTPNKAIAWHATDRIRIITFYQAQVSLLKRMLRERNLEDKVTVATVDSSQGSEADVVLVSFVRSPSASRPSKWAAGFLLDDRRMNVALTRARLQLVCVGNFKALGAIEDANTIHSLVSDAKIRKAMRKRTPEKMPTPATSD